MTRHHPPGSRFAAAALVAIAFILGLVFGRASAAPRSALTTTSQPGASGAIGSVDVSARAQEGTSSGPTGAPLTDSRATSWTAATDGQASSSDAPLPPEEAIEPELGPAVEGGLATWCAPTPTHCQTWGGDAHLGAAPSFTFGDDPYRVRVCTQESPTRCTIVTVVSFCACAAGRIIDLSPAAFSELDDLSRGVIPVSVEWLPRSGLTPPATETEP